MEKLKSYEETYGAYVLKNTVGLRDMVDKFPKLTRANYCTRL